MDPKDTFLSILRESSDMGQLNVAWRGLARQVSLAQENLLKYELQYHRPIPGENFAMPTSPI